MAELADAPDLGSGVLRRVGSSPSTRTMRKWLSGRASPCQGEGREFESRLPLFYFELRLELNAVFLFHNDDK